MTVFDFFFKQLDKQFKQPVNEENARNLPVVVHSAGSIELLLYADLADYTRKNPDYTFLIPKEKEEQFKRQVRQLAVDRNVDAYWTFTVERIAEDKQFIEVACLGDGASVGWYEATEKRISPKYLKLYGPGFVFIVAQYACPVTVLVWVPFLAFYFWFQRRRRNK